MDELVVSKLSVRTQVGFSPHEIGKLQDLKVTVVLKTDLKKAGESDCVENTINLKCLTKDIMFHLENKSLKQVLLQIEKSLGRERDKNNKNAPRTIDLDISFNGSKEIQYCLPIGSSSTTWSLPDPDTLKHAHVIIPLADVTPDFIHPRTKRSLQEMARDACGEKGFITFFPTVKVEDASGNSHVMNGDDFSISKEHHEQQ
ncbi:predicted protein [Nematostella vectensis]|uniref:2-amino-4-hydroxy-6-hydroxymethyldihydropteridine diphosphokinase n=1 Tax=Nematostella vectensis TaxID=45351 RepID=A7RLU0_NEMVE|nr:uncharacterized protein LOC5519585 [Nematostella vectensis]EDO47481.1 predicted protein [Nematostella vectensis]|eukprot:XP_001639544.1 predicted protein [Nematostella vectensis]